MNKNTKKKNGPAVLSAEDMEKTIGKGLSFGAAEAYKLLRINLSFSLPKTSNCQVIGVTSSLRGEGKSTTSINIAYTMAELRLLQKYDEALTVYERALALTAPSSEMERQRAIILMLQGDSKTAQDILVASYSPSTATLEHVATIAVCAHMNADTAVYREYKALLDSYVPYAQVDLFAAGEITLEDIFLSHGGEIQ